MRRALLLLAACTTSPTRIDLAVTSDPSWSLDGYELHVGFHAALSEPLDQLELQIPDSLAGMEQPLEVWGTAGGKQMAYGTTMVTPVAHSTVHAEVMLATLDCTSTCMQGATECMGDATVTCDPQPTGCFDWSAPVACPSATPFCSSGTCSAQCSDECTTGQRECDGVATRMCGQFDSDSCLDWSPAMACAAPADGDATCSNATCGFTCHPGFTKSGSRCVPNAVAALPTGRTFLGGALGKDGLVYAVGGQDGAVRALPTVEAYSPVTNSWTSRAAMPENHVAFGLALGGDNKLYAIAGYDGTDYASVNQAYTPASNSWQTRGLIGFVADDLASVEGADGRIYTVGGIDPNTGSALNTLHVYDPASDSWSELPGMPTARASIAAAVGSDGTIYVIGGGFGGSVVATVEAFKPGTSGWKTLAPLPTPRRSAAAAAGADGRIYVFGGWGASTPIANVDIYNPTTNTWSSGAAMPDTRYGHAAVRAGGLIYVFGGSGSSCTACTAVHAYSPASNTWSP